MVQSDADKREMLLQQYKNKSIPKEAVPLVNKGPVIKASMEEGRPKVQVNTFKFRTFLASVLFIGFLLAGSLPLEIRGINLIEIKNLLGENMNTEIFTKLFDFMDGFTYTLKDL